MKKNITVIGVLCLAVTVVGCSTSFAGEKAGTIVELEGNPTTGYVWEVDISNPDIVKEMGNEYISSQLDDDVVGVGGVFRFNFQGVAPGETEITFKYHRPWEEDTPPLDTVTYTAVVDSNHVVTLIKR